MEATIRLQEVTKRFRKVTAVERLDLTIPPETIFGFIGPNGSGKTTTLRLILRIFYPDAGRVEVLGRDHGAAADDRIGYLPEERGLYRKMQIRELLLFHAALKSNRQAGPEADRWLQRFELSHYANKKVETLSKGMSQKIQFIAAVIARPQLLILDEPFSGLDPVNMEVLRDAILEQRRQGTTIIFSTHDMDVAERMCDRIGMIFRGQKVLDGTLESIQQQYGQDTIRIRTDANGLLINNLPGVDKVNDYGQYQELRIRPDSDPQQILQQLISHTRVHHFEIARPSLHDIFIRIAGPAVQHSTEAQHV
ncbi:MAG: Daunorubicin/doxorubicin resistance ATP-binding protein DrrA [Phycisphaerae bacterium]|nr:Daunorubicin/doxorubicin resistance ATP-binding protein DrrA [Phycisphaerae bacterium]